MTEHHSLFLDKQFIDRVSYKLDLFSWVRPNLGLARCPLCGDSKKKKHLRRFYIYQDVTSPLSTHMAVKCHNCGYSASFSYFLKTFDDPLYREYSLEKFKESGAKRKPSFELSDPLEVIKEQHAPELILRRLEAPQFNSAIPFRALPEKHSLWSVFAFKRHLPDTFIDQLYFAQNFNDFVDEIRPDLKFSEDSYPEPRIIIPFFDSEHKLTMVQGRSLSDSGLRYITIKMDDSNDKIYGLDRVDLSKDVYVVEGPIDSWFLPNCIATADSDLTSACKYASNPILVYDNQYRNKEIRDKVKRSIDQGYRVVLFPSNIVGKDINDMVIRYGLDHVQTVVKSNIFQGLSAKLKFGKMI